MNDSKVILNMADDINCLKRSEEIGEYYLKAFSKLTENQYNLKVMLLGMCINKELTIRIYNEQNEKAGVFHEKLNQIYDVILKRYKEYNCSVVKNQFFFKYLEDITERILSGVKYVEKKADEPWQLSDERNVWNTQYHREERIRDRMKALITKNKEYTQFTKENKIQLPYMYVLAWDLPNLLRKYEERNNEISADTTSYLELLPDNVRNCLNFLDDNTLDILLYGIQTDRDKYEDGTGNDAIRILKNISFRELLPTIIEVKEKSCYSIDDLEDKSGWVKARKEHIRPYIKKEILSKKPLVPMEIDKNKCSVQLLRMMVDVLKEENKTRSLNKRLTEKNIELENLNNEKIDMMDYYAHSWKHISYPKIVKDVAEALLSKEDDDSITMANKLLRAYNSEQTLKHGIRLLQYSISEDKEKVRKEFKKGFFVINVPKEDGIVGIDTILYESLDMVILKLMMDDVDSSRRMKKCRSKIENIKELREEYTENFLKNPKKEDTLLEWINTNLFYLTIEISEEWNAVRLDKESFAAAQMTEIFVELLTNILQHGNKSAKLVLSSNTNSMDIFGHNDCSTSKMRKEGKGIKTLENVINKINFKCNFEKGIVYKKTDSEYSIHIKFDKRIVYKG